jgi:hypothetical protein
MDYHYKLYLEFDFDSSLNLFDLLPYLDSRYHIEPLTINIENDEQTDSDRGNELDIDFLLMIQQNYFSK